MEDKSRVQFEELGLSEDLLKVISAKKFETPSEIQQKSIPLVLKGKDVVAGSATGSGKTLAFGAGMIMDTVKGKGVQGLILTPTRELAEQVASALEEFSYHKKLEIAAVYGGVSINPQMKKLTYADIVVATPGRLLDHMNRKSIDLSNVKYLVLDEADRMWDMGFKYDVGKIVKVCPKNRQTMLFSATITAELADFSEKYMKKPIEISVESYVDPTKLKQVYYDCRDDAKFSLLVHFLKNEKAKLVMVFCNTRMNSDFVASNLKEKGVDANVIHGGMDQSKRMRVLKKFDEASVNVLVCTDVAARGLDIPSVSHVYNYDFPSDAKDYIHRIGRTARAGAEGIAVTIITSRDYDNFANFQKHFPEVAIKREMTPRFEKVFVKWDNPRRNGRDPRRGSSPRTGGVKRVAARGRFGGRPSGNRNGRSSSGPRRSSGGRDNRRGGGGDSRGRDSRRDSRGPRSGSAAQRTPKHQGHDNRGREQRGERNKRTSSGRSFGRSGGRSDSKGGGSSSPRSGRPAGRSGGRDGFRGGGRNTRRTSGRR